MAKSEEYWRQALDDLTNIVVEAEKERVKLQEVVKELTVAIEETEALDFRDGCPECGGQVMPELCSTCHPAADEARLKRRAALAKAAELQVGLEHS